MKTVLVTNSQQRKALSVIRSLGKRGVRVVTADETFFTPGNFSKYVHKALVYPNPTLHPKAFFEWLTQTIEKYRCDILFPMDEDTLEVMYEHLEVLQGKYKIILPDKGTYDRALHKKSSSLLALSLGVPAPKTLEVESYEDVVRLSTSLTFPLIVKATNSSGSRGIRRVENQEELVNQYKKVTKEYGLPIVQEYLEIGRRYSLGLLLDEESEVVASFLQEELRHYPIPMGPSVIQKSMVNEEILQQGIKIAKALQWKGIIQMDFMEDRKDGVIKFMEINPRFWGSLELAVHCGVDFPWLYYQLCIGEKFNHVTEYPVGVFCKWSLPADILHLISSKERWKLKNRDKENYHDDIWSIQDPGPTVGFLLACFRYVFSIRAWKMMFFR